MIFLLFQSAQLEGGCYFLFSTLCFKKVQFFFFPNQMCPSCPQLSSRVRPAEGTLPLSQNSSGCLGQTNILSPKANLCQEEKKELSTERALFSWFSPPETEWNWRWYRLCRVSFRTFLALGTQRHFLSHSWLYKILANDIRPRSN